MSFLEADKVIFLSGRLSVNEDERKVFAETVTLLQPGVPIYKAVNIILRETGTEILNKLKEVLLANPGKTPVNLYFPASKRMLKLEEGYWVEPTPTLKQKIEKICGTGAVRLTL
jgi:DNA polymerase-3 subunit alpha